MATKAGFNSYLRRALALLGESKAEADADFGLISALEDQILERLRPAEDAEQELGPGGGADPVAALMQAQAGGAAAPQPGLMGQAAAPTRLARGPGPDPRQVGAAIERELAGI